MVGAAAGLLNGLLVTRVGLPPFIVTLGTLGIFTSLTLLYASGRTVRNRELDDIFKVLGKPLDLGGFRITYGVIAMLLLYAVFAYVLRYTAWGAHVYAVGDDPDAARLAGIEVKRVLLSVYVTAGFIFAIAGWVLIGRINAASPNSGVDANLDSITAVVIGGTSPVRRSGEDRRHPDRGADRRRGRERSRAGRSGRGLQAPRDRRPRHPGRLGRPVDPEGTVVTRRPDIAGERPHRACEVAQ